MKTAENNENACRDASSVECALAKRLRAKYVTISELRSERTLGEASDTSLRIRELAHRYPGALRELDGLADTEINARIAVLDGVLAGAALPEWAKWLDRYHAWMRVALLAKRGASATSTTHDHGEPTLEERMRERNAILRPPGGRLNAWAFALVASEFRVSGREIEALLCESNVSRALCDSR